jgi:hypothetical protein
MSEPESEPKPEAKVEAKPAPGNDAARVYDQLSFDRAPVLRTVAAGEPSTARALLLGLGAAILGAAVFFLVRWITGYELGLISIFVGIGIGVAVRTGANGSSHRGFRILAVALAYLSIALTYVPTLFRVVGSAAGALFVALTVPVQLLVSGEIMAVIIVGIALWEAWRFSAPQVVAVQAPPPGPPAPPAPPPP